MRLPFPLKSRFKRFVSASSSLTIEEDWTWKGTTYTKGALLSFDFAELKARTRANADGDAHLHAGRPRIDRAGRRARATACSSPLYENVKGALYSYAFADRQLDALEDRPAGQRLDRRRLDARRRRPRLRQRRGLPRARRALSRRRRDGQVREGEVAAAALRRVRHGGRAVRSDLDRRHEDPVLRRAQEGHRSSTARTRRCSTPMAASRSR